MAKKKNSSQRKPTSKKREKRSKAQAARKGSYSQESKSFLWVLLGLLALATLAYIPAFQAGFVNWDDRLYVLENPTITNFSWENIQAMFSQFFVGNYHPLTIFSLAINYQISGLDASSYHLFNVLLHLANASLVLLFIYKLTDKKLLVAAIVAFFFAVHPMHVESVAWVSGRKDVLYALFFLLGLIQYLVYLEKKNMRKLIYAALFFVLACLAKPAAVIFPVVLVLVDYFKGRKWLGRKALIEKVPFLLISVIFGAIALMSQQDAGALDDSAQFSFFQKILFACYSLMNYFIKAIVPLNQSCYYPYPLVEQGLAWQYYLAPLGALGLAAIAWISRKKAAYITFGLLFFLVNLLLVLQLITVGGAIMAERYTYIPYIGLFFMLGMGIYSLEKSAKGRKLTSFSLALTGLLALIFLYLNHQQAKVWKDGETLWTQAIASFPVDRTYANRADHFKKTKQAEKALADFNKALEIKGPDANYLISRGSLLFDMKRFQAALNDFTQALTLDPSSAEKAQAYANIGSVYGSQGQNDEALEALNLALLAKADHTDALLARANVLSMLGDLDEALVDFDKYISLRPNSSNVRALGGMGTAYFNKGQYDQAFSYFSQAIQSGQADAQIFMSRSQCYFLLGDKAKALQDANRARQMGLQIPESYFNQLKAGQ